MTTFQFILKAWTVIDGDTINVELDLGMRLRWTGLLRIHGINAPEIHGDEAAAGVAVRTWVNNWLANNSSSPTQPMEVVSYEWDKFGRLLGDVDWLPGTGAALLGTTMVRKGLAKPWDGKGKRPAFTAEECAKIVEAVKV